MNAEGLPPITVTEHDFVRLGDLVEGHARGRDASLVARLCDELARATVLPTEEVPPDVVTLGSLVTYRDLNRGVSHEVKLVLPGQADAQEGGVSVLAPVGCALLGLAVGQAIEWPLPAGRVGRFQLTAVQQRSVPSAGLSSEEPASRTSQGAQRMKPDRTNRHDYALAVERAIREASLDRTIAESFPASDPPSSNPNPLDDEVLGLEQRRALQKARDRDN